jgi:hypothetical protein
MASTRPGVGTSGFKTVLTPLAGLLNLSGTRLQRTGAAHGEGIYLRLEFIVIARVIWSAVPFVFAHQIVPR